MNELNNIDEAISSLPPCLFEIPDDKEYAKGLAGQIRAVPITQDTRKAIKALITEQVRLGIEAHFQAIVPDEGPFAKPNSDFADGYTKAIEDVCDNHYSYLIDTTLLEGDEK